MTEHSINAISDQVWARWVEYLKTVGYESKPGTALANLINFFEDARAKVKKE